MIVKDVIVCGLNGIRYKTKQFKSSQRVVHVVYADIVGLSGKPEWCWQIWGATADAPPDMWFDNAQDLIAELQSIYGANAMPTIVKTMQDLAPLPLFKED